MTIKIDLDEIEHIADAGLTWAGVLLFCILCFMAWFYFAKTNTPKVLTSKCEHSERRKLIAERHLTDGTIECVYERTNKMTIREKLK